MTGSTPLLQETLIAAVQDRCRGDRRIAASLMYGSFTQGEGDAFADIEFWFFLEEEASQTFDLTTWLEPVGPVLALVDNEFGGRVAVFAGLIRGEFHLAGYHDLERLANWPLGDEAFEPEAMIVTDRHGTLRTNLERLRERGAGVTSPDRLQGYGDRFLDWFLFGLNLLARGERARALDILAQVQRHLAWLARIVHGAHRRHFLTPSKRLEEDLPATAVSRYVETTASLRGTELESAYRQAWSWGRELMTVLVDDWGTAWHGDLMAAIEQRVGEWLGSEGQRPGAP